jgi:outer membrane murein-binding lipoprotein Lpp
VKSINCEIDQLKGEIDQLNGEIDQLKGEIDQLKGEIDQLKGEIDQLNGEIDQNKALSLNLDFQNQNIPNLQGVISFINSPDAIQLLNQLLNSLDSIQLLNQLLNLQDVMPLINSQDVMPLINSHEIQLSNQLLDSHAVMPINSQDKIPVINWQNNIINNLFFQTKLLNLMNEQSGRSNLVNEQNAMPLISKNNLQNGLVLNVQKNNYIPPNPQKEILKIMIALQFLLNVLSQENKILSQKNKLLSQQKKVLSDENGDLKQKNSILQDSLDTSCPNPTNLKLPPNSTNLTLQQYSLKDITCPPIKQNYIYKNPDTPTEEKLELNKKGFNLEEFAQLIIELNKKTIDQEELNELNSYNEMFNNQKNDIEKFNIEQYSQKIQAILLEKNVQTCNENLSKYNKNDNAKEMIEFF